MNDHMTPAEQQAAAAHRRAAAEFAERLRPNLSALLRNMPPVAVSAEQIGKRLEQLGSALRDVPAAEPLPLREDPSSAPAFCYAAALASYGRMCAEFRELEPDPLRSAALLMGYTAGHREQLGGHLPAVAAFLELADVGEPSPEQAREALESFGHPLPLAGFLAAHHVLSMSAELLGAADFPDPAATFRELLGILRGEVYAVPVSVPRAEA